MPLPKQKRDEFKEIMSTPIKDIEFVIQNIISTMRKMNRDGKIEDWNFTFLHKDIEMVFKDYHSPIKK